MRLMLRPVVPLIIPDTVLTNFGTREIASLHLSPVLPFFPFCLQWSLIGQRDAPRGGAQDHPRTVTSDWTGPALMVMMVTMAMMSMQVATGVSYASLSLLICTFFWDQNISMERSELPYKTN